MANVRCAASSVTVGVMNRVMELADREQSIMPERGAPFWRFLTLQQIVAQSLDVGPQSKKVNLLYRDLLEKLGPELTILWALPLDEIARHASDIVTEAIRRVRAGELSIEAGFDGEYGTVKLFGEGERDQVQGPGHIRAGAERRSSKGKEEDPYQSCQEEKQKLATSGSVPQRRPI